MESKFREVGKDYRLKVGDKVIAKHAFGTTEHIIQRVTKTMAVSQHSKFYPVTGFWFSYKPRPEYDTNRYTVYELLP